LLARLRALLRVQSSARVLPNDDMQDLMFALYLFLAPDRRVDWRGQSMALSNTEFKMFWYCRKRLASIVTDAILRNSVHRI